MSLKLREGKYFLAIFVQIIMSFFRIMDAICFDVVVVKLNAIAAGQITLITVIFVIAVRRKPPRNAVTSVIYSMTSRFGKDMNETNF